jgi:thiol-disulfide isomerase/thioredoxin
MSAGDRRHEHEADDRFLELCLDEQLGQRRPPDLAARVLAAGADTRQHAAEELERATLDAQSDALPGFDVVSGAPAPIDLRSSPQRRGWWLAVAAVAVGAVALWFVVSRTESAHERADLGPVVQGPEAPAPTAPTPHSLDVDALAADAHDGALQALLDRFHAAMPREPERLRDADERARVAPAALPVLRKLIAHRAEARTATSAVSRAAEFEVYAVALGAADVRARVEQRAARGDSEAGFVLHVAELIVADGASARSAAMHALVQRLEAHEPLTSAVARTLVAVDLDEQEFDQLLVRLEDELLAESLTREAAEARHDPRNWIGSRSTFEGVTPDGGSYSTASWNGDVGVVVFWASWCKPCESLLDAVLAARERYATRTLRVAGISCDFDEAELRAHLDAHPRQDWPQLFDAASPGWHELAVAHDVRWIPTAFVIGRDGVVRDVVRGADELDRALARLFAERPR